MTNTNGHWSECYKCKTSMWIPPALEEAARHAPGVITFFCAYGHGQVYAVGETEAEKLRRERDRLAQQIAQRDDEIRRQRELREATERQLAAAKGQVTKIKNRVSAGVCPCCNRSFENLMRHMHSKHPDYSESKADNVVPLKATA